MNKILSIYSDNQIQQINKIRKTDGFQFQQEFNIALKNSETTDTNQSCTKSLGEIRPVNFNKIEYPAADIAKQTSNLIDLIDNYQKDISNSNKTLKEIEPLIVEINKRASLLVKDADETLQHDKQLKDIVHHCVLTANVEYIKFRRGDYC